MIPSNAVCLLLPMLCLGTHYPRESNIDYASDGTARQSLAVARSQAEPGNEVKEVAGLPFI